MQNQYHSNIAAILSIAGLLLFLPACQRVSTGDDGNVMYNACTYLWNAQSDDGGWHSETHTILRDGASLTPFILAALLEVPESKFTLDSGRVKRGVDFVRKHVQSQLVADSIPLILDYPNYAAAYALIVLQRTGSTGDSALIQALTTYLTDQQYAEHRGIDVGDAAYGGWGFGETNLVRGAVGHVDLSHARRVLQALHLVLQPDDEVFGRARIYLDRVQNDRPGGVVDEDHLDGGFFTSIVTPETNKSSAVPGVESTWYSYATATCDGVLARVATGQGFDDFQVVQALDWLQRNDELTYPEGIPEDDPMQWHLVMKYYHLAVRGEVNRIAGVEAGWSEQMREILRKDQRADGSFINQMGGPNKEDDPLLATAFAVIALSGT